jgi:hypothetical protein
MRRFCQSGMRLQEGIGQLLRWSFCQRVRRDKATGGLGNRDLGRYGWNALNRFSVGLIRQPGALAQLRIPDAQFLAREIGGFG